MLAFPLLWIQADVVIDAFYRFLHDVDQQQGMCSRDRLTSKNNVVFFLTKEMELSAIRKYLELFLYQYINVKVQITKGCTAWSRHCTSVDAAGTRAAPPRGAPTLLCVHPRCSARTHRQPERRVQLPHLFFPFHVTVFLLLLLFLSSHLSNFPAYWDWVTALQ